MRVTLTVARRLRTRQQTKHGVRIVARHLQTAYQNLSTLLAAGVPLLRALKTSGTRLSGRTRAAWRDIADSAANGSSLAEAMALHPRIFKRIDRLVVRAGENSGMIAEVFEELAHWQHVHQRTRRLLISGLLYPLILIHVAVLLIPLPPLILGRIGPVDYALTVLGHLMVFYVPLAVLALLHARLPDTGLFRRLCDGLLIRMPVLGKAVRMLALSRFCRSFHMLLAAGVPIASGVEQALDACGNISVRGQLAGGADSVHRGRPFAAGLDPTLQLDFRASWEVAEQSGRLDDVSRRLADSCAEQAHFLFEQWAKWLPRIVYAVICLWIAANIIRSFASILPSIPA